MFLSLYAKLEYTEEFLVKHSWTSLIEDTLGSDHHQKNGQQTFEIISLLGREKRANFNKCSVTVFCGLAPFMRTPFSILVS